MVKTKNKYIEISESSPYCLLCILLIWVDPPDWVLTTRGLQEEVGYISKEP